MKHVMFTLVAGILICSGCFAVQGQFQVPAVNVIFDTDMGSDCDDVGALALLHAYADMGRANILGCIYSSGRVPYGAGVIEAINIYYGRGAIPVGAYHGDDLGDPVDKMKAKELAQNTVRFGNRIVHNRDAEDMTRLNRKLLVAQPDGSVVYLTVGHTKGLHDLLVSKPDTISRLSGRELVEKKVKEWIAMGAANAYNDGEEYRHDWNLWSNDTAPCSKYLLENFPKPMTFVTPGADVLTGKSLKQTPPGNIVRTAYEQWLGNVFNKTLDDQRSSWDLIAVYFAVEGFGPYLTKAPEGALDLDIQKGCRWNTAKYQVNQTLILQKKGTNGPLADYLNRMIARPPRLHQ